MSTAKPDPTPSHLPRLVLALSVVVAMACAGTGEGPRGDERPEAGAKFDAAPHRTREADPLPEADGASPDGRFHFTVPGEPSYFDTGPDSPVSAFRIGMGTRADAQCFVYPEGIHLAAALIGASDRSLRSRPGVEIAARQFEEILAGVAGGHPYIGVRWAYVTVEDGSRLLGEYTIYVAAKFNLGVICVHDEVGYEASFFRVFEALVASLEDEGFDWVEPYRVDAMTSSIGGHLAGVSWVSMTRDEEGDTAIETTSAVVVPAAPDALTGEDSLEIQYSTEEGELINAFSISVESGRLASELALKPRRDAGRWQVTGMFAEQDFAAEIEAGELVSERGQQLALQRAIAEQGPGAELVFQVWVPDIDPRGLVEVRYVLGEQRADGDYDVKMTIGPVEADAVVEPDATLKSMRFGMGQVEVEQVRIYETGEL